MTEDRNNTLISMFNAQLDPLTFLFAVSLMGFTKGLWRVSGEGSGGVTRAFGEDLWDFVKIGSDLLGEDRDLSSPQKAMEFYDNYLIKRFNLAESIDFSVDDDTLNMTVTNCRVHHYTDHLAENDVPRSVGCPLALIGTALMEEVTGEPFVVTSIESKDANSQIVLNKL